MIGTSLKHYRIVEKIGEGGMGAVYRALDTHLDRAVAIKVLRPDAVGDAERKWRFVREAKAASALNDPRIVTIHDIDSDGGIDFIVMEYVDGTSLDRLIPSSGLPLSEALDYAEQIASALGAAHEAGIVHRDVKPANIMVTRGGRVKVLDFGLAKLVETAPAESAATSDSTATAETAVARTRQGAILGTIAYMSPEQAQGQPLDARSDVFSLGCVVYEMLTGHRPFGGDSHLQTLAAILRDPAPPLAIERPDIPAQIEAIVRRSLEKRPQDRYATAGEMAADLSARRLAPASALSPPERRLRPAIVYATLAILVAGIGGAAVALVHASRVRHAKTVIVPRISNLLEQQKPGAAVRLARDAERDVPAEVAKLRADWMLASVETEPPGADVWMRDYLSSEADWQPMGKTPIRGLRIPMGYYRWKLAKEGYQTIEAAGALAVSRRLDPVSSVPAGMVRVSGSRFALRSLNPVELSDFWIDRYEVTNREFKRFIDAGGYSKRDYWKQPFLRSGRELSWEEAVGRFRDATGRPGPVNWELGTFPEGQADLPVDGISWYEAAAYAEFAGKSLPTVYHWYRAAGIGAPTEIFSDILRVSNFGGKGPWSVGSGQGMSPFGSYDMAGNVKEWCWNATGERRYLLGGSWTEVNYMFRESDAQDPFSRGIGYGLRCVRYTAPLATDLTQPIPVLTRDYSKETPVSEDVFRVYRSLYSYDHGPLDARVDAAEEDSPYWKRQKVSVLAAYGNERVPMFLFLPKNAKPPYQTVVYFPSSHARIARSSAELETRFLDFVIRSGRAVVHPIYKDTYERHVEQPQPGPNFRRDLVIQWSKDLGRTLDYLQTRPDIDRERLAYYGMSLGAIDGIVLVAVEPRFKTAIFTSGGFRFDRAPPEVEPINFAPRIHIPVLLIGGRYDFAHPYETAQVPAFRLLGTPEGDKKHFVFEGGHIAPKIQPIIKEILDWLDRYLGPVAAAG